MSNDDLLLKLRLSRLLSRQGYFVRRNVPISTYTAGEYKSKRIDITDIDVLGFRWDVDFARSSLVCECKSGAKAKPLDRCFWLAGVMKYFDARKGYLIVKESGSVPRRIGQQLGIAVLSETNLSVLEKRFNIQTDKWFGSMSPMLNEKTTEYRKILKSVFPKQLNYLVYGYWKDAEYFQLKRLLAIGREVANKLSDTEATKWFAYELLCLLSSSMATFCNQLFLSETGNLRDETSTELFGGFVSRTEREGIAKSAIQFLRSYVEDYYEGKLALQTEDLSMDPDYIDKIVELITRLLDKPGESRVIPLFLDFVCYEFLYNGRTITKEALLDNFGGYDIYLLAKLAKNVVEFYLETTRINRAIYEPFLKF